MTKNILILFCLIIFNLSFGQNLINNPSFELARADAPDVDKTWDYYTCYDWFSATTKGTPDYFTAKRLWNYGVPTNIWGVRDAHSGIAYVGIGADEGRGNYKLFEYLEIKLNQKLIKDKSYCLSLYISPSDSRNFSTNEIDYYFSSEKQSHNTSGLINVTGYEKFVASNGYFEQKSWNKIETCYKAKGGEEFLTLGWFHGNFKRICFNPDTTQYSNQYNGIYFYLDDISLVPLINSSECKCNQLTVHKSEITNYALAKDQPLIIKNLYFENNKSQLLPSSDVELYKLAHYLRTNPSFKTEIIGYTDNIGKEKDNILLSTSRAKSVADFLINAGVAKDKIIFKGLGSKFPIKPNDTEQNKQLNRRVEFRILK